MPQTKFIILRLLQTCFLKARLNAMSNDLYCLSSFSLDLGLKP